MIIALVILLCIALLCFAPVKVDICYLLYRGQNKFKIKVGLFLPFVTVFENGRKKEKLPKKTEKEGNATEKREINLELIKNIFSQCAKLFSYFRKHLSIEKLKLHFHIGTEEAALTGIATGAAWGALYDIAAILDNVFLLKDKNIHVCPKFDGAIFETDTNIRLSIKLINLLIFAGKTYKSIKELKFI